MTDNYRWSILKPKRFGNSAGASIKVCDYTEKNVPIICVECKLTGHTEKAYGNQLSSKKRALATLTENCSCQSDWHFLCEDIDET